jgi:hypothetical protein
MKMLGVTSDDWGPFRDPQPVSDLGGSQSITIIVVDVNKRGENLHTLVGARN